MSDRSIINYASRAERVAGILAVLSVIFLIGGVLGGIALAFQTDTSVCFSDTGSCSSSSSHPFIGVGIGLAIAGVFYGLFGFMICDYIRMRAHLAVRAVRGPDQPPPQPPMPGGWQPPTGY